MKKTIISLVSIGAALLTFASCSQSLLEIPQKGVLNYEMFYDDSEESAESAALAIYSAYVTSMNMGVMDELPTWVIAPVNYVLTNAPSDDSYYGSGGKSDHIFGLEINEYRPSFDSGSLVVRFSYKAAYNVIYTCNLLIDNFNPATSEKIARNVAEARVFRAMAHLHLATYWGTPPKVDHLLAGDARPTNSNHDELMAWIIKELDEAAEALPPRAGKGDKNGAVRLTKEAAYAYEGKAQVFAGDYNGAKATLKKVIDSGNYELVPGPEMVNMFHRAGDGSTEKVFEFNYVDNVNIGIPDGFRHFQRSQSCFWRDLKVLPNPFFKQNDGWGGGGNPSKSFVDAIMANEPDSYRRKAWIISYEELIGDYDYSGRVAEDKENGLKAGEDLTRDEKMNDPRLGLSAPSYYGNVGWFLVKYAPLETELNVNSIDANDNNTVMMRYAEVLLLYAEACAMAGDDGSGLAALNEVARRAGAPLYSSLTLDNVKKEKRFEMFMEGCRFADLVRWGDAATVLKDQGREVPSFIDLFEEGKHPHEAKIDYSDAYYNDEYGFKAGKNELMPFPLGELQLNPYDEAEGVGIKQNPGWR
ncbi:MAG: RagB/SusD family nutrient uptake outer membrane protein [Bacteroidales bacterium]|nr:RagB/SusD family nutrient uptake outer membrane protein [Bacteroidales bacterium]